MTRHTFTIPTNLDGCLVDELLAAGIEASVYVESDVLAFYTDADESAVRSVVEAHDPSAPTPLRPTPEERIATLEAEVKGIKDRAAVEAAKATQPPRVSPKPSPRAANSCGTAFDAI